MRARKGVFFTLDAVFGLMILMTLYGVFTLLSIETVSAEALHENLHTYSEDAIDVLSKMRLWDIRSDPIVLEVCNSKAFDIGDINKTALDAVGALWANNETGLAGKLVSRIFRNSMPPNIEWAIVVGNGTGYDSAYNTSRIESGRYMSAVSRRLVSGYMKGRKSYGYTSKAYLSNVFKNDVEYIFFGGFVGQGNISVYARSIPSDATVTELYLEMALGGNFTLKVNGTSCGLFKRETGPYAVSNWTIVDPACLNNMQKGNETRIDLEFKDNLSDSYIGGGYIRIRYLSEKIPPSKSSYYRYYFPGIDGLVNLYDSFYIPGNITNISGRLNVTSNYSLLLSLGNQTPVTINGTDKNMLIELLDVNFTSVQPYDKISSTTVPLRLGTPNATLLVDASIGDIVLVNDVSGSMRWCSDQSESCCSPPPKGTCPEGTVCTCPLAGTESCVQEARFFNHPATGKEYCAFRWNSTCKISNPPKINVSINASKEFMKIVLATGDNRVGIVEYSSNWSAKSNTPDLTIPPSTIKIRLIEKNGNQIILPDNGVMPGRAFNYTINATVVNNGFTCPRSFNVSFYNVTYASFNPANPALNRIGSVEVPPLANGQNATVSINWTTSINCSAFPCILPVLIYADADNVIAESDETNNAAETQLVANLPDLVVNRIWWYWWMTWPYECSSGYGVKMVNDIGRTYSGSCGTNLCRNFTNTSVALAIQEIKGVYIGDTEFNFTVSFQGTNGVWSNYSLKYSNVTIRGNDDQYVVVSVNSSFMNMIGDAVNWSLTPPYGKITFEVRADPLNIIPETDESYASNTGREIVYAKKPDLTASLVVYPNRVCGSAPVQVTLSTIALVGPPCPVVDSFNISVYQDFIDDPPNSTGHMAANDKVILNLSSFLDVDGYASKSDLYTTSLDDTSFWAWVDNPPAPYGIVQESNEDNNKALYNNLRAYTLPNFYPGIGIDTALTPVNNFETFKSDLAHEPSTRDYNTICFGEDVGITVDVMVYNNGCPYNGKLNVSLYKDSVAPGNLLGIQEINYNGGVAIVPFPITLNIMADTPLIGVIDPTNQIPEEVEGDNQISMLISERPSDLVAIQTNITPSGPYWDESGIRKTCTGMSNYYNVTFAFNNSGPCNIYRDFNASVKSDTSYSTPGSIIKRDVVHGLKRGSTYVLNASYWNGVRPDTGVNIDGLPFWEAYIMGVVDYPPTDQIGAIWERKDGPGFDDGTWADDTTSNQRWTYMKFNGPDINITSSTAYWMGGDNYEIRTTVKNEDPRCRTKVPFNVSYYEPALPFTPPGGQFYKVTGVTLNPGQSVQVTGLLTKSFQPGVNWIYAWADADGVLVNPYLGTLLDPDFGKCNAINAYSCNNINKTNVSYPEGGWGAPYVDHPKQVLLSALQNPTNNPEISANSNNLEISSFSVSPANAICGSTTKFKLLASIGNKGSRSESGVVDFYSGDQKIGSAAIPGLGSGEKTEISFNWEGVLHNDTVFAAMTGSSSRSFMVKDPATCVGPREEIFPGSIVRSHGLSNDLAELTSFVNESDTWYETCICCGIINATRMLNATGRAGSLQSIVLLSDGKANFNCSGMTPRMTGDPIADAINASCEAYEKYGVRVYTVGFGIDVDEDTLTKIANCGGGQYYSATDTNKLIDAYRVIAATLLKLSYKNQVLEAVGAQRTTLYPDSYLEFTYKPKVPPLGYRDFVVTIETEQFSSCEGEFSVPLSFTPFDIKAVSYSADRWTNEVKVRNSTGSTWTVFNLSDFGSGYPKLGDPYIVEFDPTDPLGPGAQYPGIINRGPSLYINISTGSVPGDFSSDCPNRNKVIYKAIIEGSVPFSPVLPAAIGRNVTVYYDLRSDENWVNETLGRPAESPLQITIGKDLPGIPFVSENISIQELESERSTNSLADTFLRLMDELNFYQAGPAKCASYQLSQDPAAGQVCCYDQPSGSYCNPIDVKITQDIIMRSVAINEVPYMYGPIDIGVVTWIK